MPSKKELQREIDELEKEYDSLTSDYLKAHNRADRAEAELCRLQDRQKRSINLFGYAGSISFDFWPPEDWKRLKVYKWNASQYFQIYLGPIRFDWYAS